MLGNQMLADTLKKSLFCIILEITHEKIGTYNIEKNW